jgi:hypothetical protein
MSMSGKWSSSDGCRSKSNRVEKEKRRVNSQPLMNKNEPPKELGVTLPFKILTLPEVQIYLFLNRLWIKTINLDFLARNLLRSPMIW